MAKTRVRSSHGREARRFSITSFSEAPRRSALTRPTPTTTERSISATRSPSSPSDSRVDSHRAHPAPCTAAPTRSTTGSTARATRLARTRHRFAEGDERTKNLNERTRRVSRESFCSGHSRQISISVRPLLARPLWVNSTRIFGAVTRSKRTELAMLPLGCFG